MKRPLWGAVLAFAFFLMAGSLAAAQPQGRHAVANTAAPADQQKGDTAAPPVPQPVPTPTPSPQGQQPPQPITVSAAFIRKGIECGVGFIPANKLVKMPEIRGFEKATEFNGYIAVVEDVETGSVFHFPLAAARIVPHEECVEAIANLLAPGQVDALDQCLSAKTPNEQGCLKNIIEELGLSSALEAEVPPGVTPPTPAPTPPPPREQSASSQSPPPALAAAQDTASAAANIIDATCAAQVGRAYPKFDECKRRLAGSTTTPPTPAPTPTPREQSASSQPPPSVLGAATQDIDATCAAQVGWAYPKFDECKRRLAGSSTPPVPQPVPTPAAGEQLAASGGFIGCYADRGAMGGTAGRDLDGAFSERGDLTMEKCVAYCGSKGFSYAGTQYASQCFCGDAYGKFGASDACRMPCAGNPNEICGGSWANSVYSTTARIGAPNRPPPQPASTSQPGPPGISADAGSAPYTGQIADPEGFWCTQSYPASKVLLTISKSGPNYIVKHKAPDFLNSGVFAGPFVGGRILLGAPFGDIVVVGNKLLWGGLEYSRCQR